MDFTRCSARGGWGWWIALCAVLSTTAYIPQGNSLKLLLFVTYTLEEPSNVCCRCWLHFKWVTHPHQHVIISSCSFVVHICTPTTVLLHNEHTHTMSTGSTQVDCYIADGCFSVDLISNEPIIRDCCVGQRNGTHYRSSGGPCTECIGMYCWWVNSVLCFLHTNNITVYVFN